MNEKSAEALVRVLARAELFDDSESAAVLCLRKALRHGGEAGARPRPGGADADRASARSGVPVEAVCKRVPFSLSLVLDLLAAVVSASARCQQLRSAAHKVIIGR